MKKEYINRYGSKHTFTLKEDGNIFWDGDFTYGRIGVTALQDEINMVDPSGGPYLDTETNLNDFGFSGLKIKDFKRVDKGYLIITEKI